MKKENMNKITIKKANLDESLDFILIIF